MWHAIELHLRQVLGHDFKIQERQKLPLNSQHQAFLLDAGSHRVYIKVSPRHHLEHFQAEAQSLHLLKQTQTLHLPEFICDSVCKDHAFIAYHYHPTKPLTDSSQAYQFGIQLAQLHHWGEQVEFGLESDNYIEHLIQPNQWHKKWAIFFAEHRIGWQLQLLKEKGLLLADIDQVVNQVKLQLVNHQPKPSLVHGNLTAEHIALSVHGPIVFQPACYWGDREFDIATLLQNTQINSNWFEGYQSIAPLPTNYQQRLPIYQLYLQLNLCNHFAGKYIEDCEKRIKSLLQF